MDFFDVNYRTETERVDKEFGICDPAGDKPAYTTDSKSGPDKWGATVINPKGDPIQFIPIDNNIIFKDEKGNKESSCDGMLVDSGMKNFLFFVELKDVRKQWIQKAVSQLKKTIAKFSASHDYKAFSIRIAYACNRRKQHNTSSHRELQQQFRRETHFALELNYNISIPDTLR